MSTIFENLAIDAALVTVVVSSWTELPTPLQK